MRKIKNLYFVRRFLWLKWKKILVRGKDYKISQDGRQVAILTPDVPSAKCLDIEYEEGAC